MRCRILPKAEQDVLDQAEYYAIEAGIHIAHAFADAVRETVALLARHPHLGWTVKMDNPQVRGLRLFV